MSAAGEIRLNDVGTIFRQYVTDCGSPVDLTSASSLHLCFKKPSGTVVTVAATVATSAAYMQYTVATSGFLDESGDWTWQGNIFFDAQNWWRTNTKTFEVFANICL